MKGKREGRKERTDRRGREKEMRKGKGKRDRRA